ncbi:MAG: hypothetical protein NXI00_16200 [Cytophagales bacterium]|nr:hypothetical protein [Cytophagales bacterium]
MKTLTLILWQLFFTFLFIFNYSCKPVDTPSPTQYIPIEASFQRGGSVEIGYQYLVTGDYVKSGVPLDIWKQITSKSPTNVLGRTGENAYVDYNNSVVIGRNKT